MLPPSKPGTQFHKYKRLVVLVWVVLLIPVSFGSLMWLLVMLNMGFVGLGLMALVFAGVVGANLFGMLGNRALERKLRGVLEVTTQEFVGLGEATNNTARNKFLNLRAETDDNVGFIGMNGAQLEIRTEDGTLRIAADAIRTVEMERLVELPFLKWIRVSYTCEDGVEDSVLVSSRNANTLWKTRDATHALYMRIVEWHADVQLAAFEDEFHQLELAEQQAASVPHVANLYMEG